MRPCMLGEGLDDWMKKHVKQYKEGKSITFERCLKEIEKWRIEMIKNYIGLHVHCGTCPKGFRKQKKEKKLK